MICIEGLSKSFGERKLFDNFSMEIADGEFVMFAGASGCGKTTLLNMIGSIEPINSGKILVDGADITKKKNQAKYLKTKVGFLFQNFALVDNKTVKENLDLVKNDCRNEKMTVTEALEAVGMQDKEKQRVFTLSGGEQQRVALARLFIKKCDIVLADEPTGSLDRENANMIFRLLEKLNEAGKTIVLVTHDEHLQQQGKKVVAL